MIEFNNTQVWGFENAIRGMRHPFKGTDKSDSGYVEAWQGEKLNGFEYLAEKKVHMDEKLYYYKIGEKDLKLATKLANAGSDHGKFLRGIHVQVDITAPTYWIAEHDTYKIATTRNSESFMHKGVSEGFNIKKFDTGLDMFLDFEDYMKLSDIWSEILETLNYLRNKYNETKDYNYFLLIRKLLPSGWKITYFWDANYATLKNIYNQRKNHRLPEWHIFCDWIETLPYSELITGEKGDNE